MKTPDSDFRHERSLTRSVHGPYFNFSSMHSPYFNYLKRHCIARTLKVLLFRQMHRYFAKCTSIFRQTKNRHLANFIWRKTIWRKTKNKQRLLCGALQGHSPMYMGFEKKSHLQAGQLRGLQGTCCNQSWLTLQGMVSDSSSGTGYDVTSQVHNV